MSSARAFLSDVISFFALLKTLSHSTDITGIERVSKAYRVFPIFVGAFCFGKGVGNVLAGPISTAMLLPLTECRYLWCLEVQSSCGLHWGLYAAKLKALSEVCMMSREE